MIDVNDRVPLYPGRVKMTPVSGQANVYDMVRADQPQKVGTPLDRNTFRKTQADIRTYPIATGNSVAAGDVVDVVDALVPVMKPLGEYTEGDVVQLNEGGVPVDFYVAKHDYEAALNGSGRTLLVRKESWPNDQINWNNNAINTYADSSIDQWFNATYKSKLDTDIQQAISTTKFYYTPGNGNTSVIALERSIFHLSATEFGLPQTNINVEGAALPIAEILRVSRVNATPVNQWTRSSNTSTSNSAAYIDSDGKILGSYRCDNSARPRPAFTLPATFEFYVGHAPSGEKEITRNVVAEANTKTRLFTGSTSSTATCRLNDKYSICVYCSSGASQIYLVDKASGKAVIQTGLGHSGITHLQVARLNDTKFIVTWTDSNNIQSMCGTVNDTTISLGNPQYLVAISNVNSQSLVPLSETSCAVIYGNSTRLGVHICTISETKITRGNDSYLASHPASYVSAILLPNDSSGNKRVCVCFSDANDGNKGKAVIATINSSNAVTWGSVVTFNDSASFLISCASNGNTVVVSYANNSACCCRVLAMNGTSIAAGSQTQFEETEIKAESSVVCIGGKFVVCGHGRTSGGAISGSYAIVLNVSGLNITVNTAYKFDPASASYLRACPISDNKLIVAYADNGNSNYGTSTILEVNGNQIAGGFTANSTQAIALESGEAGQEIEVIFAGTTAADFVTEGQKIPSDGVYGYGPVAGWLNVIPYWAKEAGVKIVTGSYVGTGSYGQSNSNSLTFQVDPKLVIIRAQQRSYDSDNMAIFIKPVLSSTSISRMQKAAGQVLGATIPCTWDKNTLTWYSTANQDEQLNSRNATYYYLVIG